MIIDRGTALPEESFAKNVIDRVTSVSVAFMGLTVQCAQCHDHKFDPITQKDFYSLSGFFNNIDAQPETSGGANRGFQEPYIYLGSSGERSKLKKMSSRISHLKGLQRNAKGTEEKTKIQRELSTLVKQHRQLESTIPKAMVMRERKDVRTTYVLDRGQYDSPGEQVERNTPSFLPKLKVQGKVATRMDLAEWFVDPANPLTARVAVNRVWQQFFGVGLVKTSDDFGNQGDVPSHPILLDNLAIGFIDSGWDFKALIKQIVMSKTYRQSSVASFEQFKSDPDNRLLSRGSRFRLDAEMIRDQILATSGLLSKKMYGPSVKPPQPKGLWRAVSMIGEVYQPDSGESTRRRSLYTFWKRSMPPPQMTILNAPLRDSCVARRERTNTPTQALLLLNEPEYLNAAKHLAFKVLQQPEQKRIEFAWETVTAQLPDNKELAILQSLLADLKGTYSANPTLIDGMLSDFDLAKYMNETEKVELSAWTIVANTLFNLDITKNRN